MNFLLFGVSVLFLLLAVIAELWSIWLHAVLLYFGLYLLATWFQTE